MKTSTAKLALLLSATLLMGLNVASVAQSRGRDRGRSNDYDQHNRNNGWHDGHRNGRDHYDRYDGYSYRRLPPQRVVVYRSAAPRYVYYRDYNVYYDYTRNAYISFSGRNWVMTTSVPVALRRVNRAGLACEHIDYYNDDFAQRLDRGWSY